MCSVDHTATHARAGCALGSCVLWVGYGVLQQVLTVVVVNGVGFTLSSVYIGVFYAYAKEKVWRPPAHAWWWLRPPDL
jgi:hypothetical protein